MRASRLNARAGSVDVAAAIATSAAPAGGQLVPIGDRIKPPFNTTGNVPGTPLSNGTNLGGTGREDVIVQVTSQGVVVDMANWYANGVEVAGVNDYTVKVALEIDGTTVGASGTKMYFTWNGQTSTNVSALAARTRSDPLGVTLTKGSEVWLWVFVSGLSAGQKFPLMRSSRSTGKGEGFNVDPSTAGPGTDITAYGTAWSADPNGKLNVRIPGVSGLYGIPAKLSSVPFLFGDSIPSGTGESSCYGATNGSSNYLDFGWFNRACNNHWPREVIGISGTTLAAWNTRVQSYRRRGHVAGLYFSHAICELGINDINASGVTLATVQGLMIAAWKDLGTYRRPVYQTTLGPYTTSTDNWASLAGQSSALPSGQEAVRTTTNDWLRDGSPITAATGVAAATGTTAVGVIRAGQAGHPLAAGDQFGKGYIEVADAAESARNSGLWKVPTFVRKVTDAAMSSGQATITSSTAAFTNNDVGLYVRCAGAGASGGTTYGYIMSVQSATQATLHLAAATTASAQAAVIGANPMCADGIHASGDYGTNTGGHQTIANAVYPQLVTILGADAT